MQLVYLPIWFLGWLLHMTSFTGYRVGVMVSQLLTRPMQLKPNHSNNQHLSTNVLLQFMLENLRVN